MKIITKIFAGTLILMVLIASTPTLQTFAQDSTPEPLDEAESSESILPPEQAATIDPGTPTPTAPVTLPTSIPETLPTASPTALYSSGPTSDQLKRGENISFGFLGEDDAVLNGPYDSYFLRFSTPANWKLVDGAKIVLHLETHIYDTANQQLDTTTRAPESYGAKLDITFDRNFVASHLLTTGEQTIAFDIPIDKLDPQQFHGEHSIYLYMDSSIDCAIQSLTTVVVRADSYIDLPHVLDYPHADLTLLPLPFYQRNTFVPEVATIVTPDQPSQSEMQAILTTAAGFGRMTSGNLQLSLLPISQLTQEIANANNLIFVGKGSSLSLLEAFNLPVPLTSGQFATTNMQTDDGILQIANSAWNGARYMLIISGNTDSGVLKAAQALSSGTIRAGDTPDMALVSSVDSSIELVEVPADRTLADLGYRDTTSLTGPGSHTANFVFYIPQGYVASSDSYFELAYNHAALLRYDLSAMTIKLNGRTVGGVKYSEESTKETRQQISLPAYAILPGVNLLTITADHAVGDYCATWINDVFTDVVSTSLLHIPLSQSISNLTELRDLSIYPYPFMSDPQLNTLAFVVPSNDPAAWETAAQLAQDIGGKSVGIMVTLDAVFADGDIETVGEDHHLIIVGKPVELPVIQTLNDKLPASFDPGSNYAQEGRMQVNYRLADNASIGYLQLLKSPWGGNTILAVLGSSDEGIQWAGAALLESTPLVGVLAGNLAVTNGIQILSNDTRLNLGTQSLLQTLAPEDLVTAAPESDQMAYLPTMVPSGDTSMLKANPKQWIPYALIVITLLIAAILTYVIRSAIKENKQNNFHIQK